MGELFVQRLSRKHLLGFYNTIIEDLRWIFYVHVTDGTTEGRERHQAGPAPSLLRLPKSGDRVVSVESASSPLSTARTP